MSPGNHRRCGGTLAWNQIQGILLFGPDGYSGQCSACGASLRAVDRPRPWAKCQALVYHGRASQRQRGITETK